MKIIRNRARCRWCGDIIESTYGHDFKWCSCLSIAVDGGLDYLKRAIGPAGTPDDLEDLSEFEYRVVIFGSRGWSDPERIRRDIIKLRNEHENLLIVQGECPDSPDSMARDFAKELGIPTLGIAARWRVHDREGTSGVKCWCPSMEYRCKAAGFRRNLLMANVRGLDEGIGYRMPGVSSGTDDMAQRLKDARVPWRIEPLNPTIFDDQG